MYRDELITYDTYDTLPQFIDQRFVYRVFHNNFEKKFRKDLCNGINTFHMFNFLKKLKKNYLISKINNMGLYNPTILSKGSYGATYTFNSSNMGDVVFKLSGQCNFDNIRQFNTFKINEININQELYQSSYNTKYGEAIGSELLLYTYGGLFIEVKNNKTKIVW